MRYKYENEILAKYILSFRPRSQTARAHLYTAKTMKHLPPNLYKTAIFRSERQKKAECTIYWNEYFIEYDKAKKIRGVTFFQHNVLGDCQTVYLSSDGKTLLIVYGE